MKVAIVFVKHISLEDMILNRFSDFISFIPHGIAYMIKYANLHGENIDFINLETLSWDEFKNVIRDYDLVGYSILSTEYYNGIKAININKKMNKNVTIIVGGVDPSVNPNKYLKNKDISHVIVGEGEISFLKIIKSKKNIENKVNNENIKKLIYGEKIENLDSLGFIDRNIFPQEHFLNPKFEERFFTIMAGRACMYNCKFCQPTSKIMFGNKLRVRSPDHVVSELNYLKDNHGLKSFHIWDDNLWQNREWLIKFIECCKITGFKATFIMPGRADNIIKNEDLIKDLYEIGLREVIIGLESGSNRMLKYFNKGTTVEMNNKSLLILNKNKIDVVGTFIFGFPGETKKDMKLTETFIKNNHIHYLELNSLVPYPGTYFADEYAKENLLFEMKTVDVSLHKPKIRGINYYYVVWFMFKIKINYQFNHNPFFKFKVKEFLVLIYSFLTITIFYIVIFLKLKLYQNFINNE